VIIKWSGGMEKEKYAEPVVTKKNMVGGFNMIREYLMLIPYLLVSVGYPMIVYYQTGNFVFTLLFAFGFFLAGASIMFLIFLPYNDNKELVCPKAPVPERKKIEVEV
jgi:hypothetical protein